MCGFIYLVDSLQTASKGKSYFEAHKKYEQWEKMLTEIKKGLDSNSPMKTMFQTSEFWPEVCLPT